MDVLRSCYSTMMRFSGIAEPVKVCWYFTKQKPLEKYTVYASRNWQEFKEGWPALGEVQGAARPWRNGSAPAVIRGGGPVGSAKAWLGSTGPPLYASGPCQPGNVDEDAEADEEAIAGRVRVFAVLEDSEADEEATETPEDIDVTGAIVLWPGATLPTGWIKCDGAVVSQATYPDLYAILGSTWGSDAGGNFTLPDFRGRVPVGVGTGTGLSARALADTGGVETHTLVTSEMPAHTHEQDANTDIVAGGVMPNNGGVLGTHRLGGTTASTGGGGAHQNMQPFACPYYIIKT